MPRDPEPLTFTTFPTYRQKLLYEVYNSPRAVLSFDPVKLDLILHYWYVATTFVIYRPAFLPQARQWGGTCITGRIAPVSRNSPISGTRVFMSAAATAQ